MPLASPPLPTRPGAAAPSPATSPAAVMSCRLPFTAVVRRRAAAAPLPTSARRHLAFPPVVVAAAAATDPPPPAPRAGVGRPPPAGPPTTAIPATRGPVDAPVQTEEGVGLASPVADQRPSPPTSPSASGSPSPRATDRALAALCDSGLPDAEVCELLDLPPANPPVLAEAWARGRWLLGLLALQSVSSLVLDSYADLLRDHLVVTLFLTMLVGAGGNAGGQSSIHVIRGLATGTLRPSAADFGRELGHQLAVGALLATGLAAGGFARVAASGGSNTDAAAISASLFAIVLTSVGVGTALPFGLARAGWDPANAGTSVQVVMDILGCAITCATCSFVLGQAAAALGGGG